MVYCSARCFRPSLTILPPQIRTEWQRTCQMSQDCKGRNKIRVSASAKASDDELLEAKMKRALSSRRRRRGGPSSLSIEDKDLSGLSDAVNNMVRNVDIYAQRLSRISEAPLRMINEDGLNLHSTYLASRIVLIDMPFVPAVTEHVMSQILFLRASDPNAPFFIYINSTGTTSAEGELLALQGEGFALYDAITSVPNEVRTVLVGQAVGHACLLLAAGKKGQRYIFPNSLAMLEQPKVPSQGQMRPDNLANYVEGAVIQRKMFIELMAKHTGQSVETVSKVMKGSFLMDAASAVEFGVADKICYSGDPSKPTEFLSPKEWRRRWESPHLPSIMDLRV